MNELGNREREVLGLLASTDARTMSTFDIVARVEEKKFVGKADAYIAFRSLERMGLIEPTPDPGHVPERRKQPRPYYRITDAGLEALLVLPHR